MFKRLLSPLNSKSFFVFGARGTGKTTFLEQLNQKKTFTINLLNPELESLYSLQPMHLAHEIKAMKKRPNWILIDEVQKVPKLLDVVHLLIESQKLKFILTGSSARKLKRGSANLLAGRANVYNLFPLTCLELGDSFDLISALHWGTLPSIFSFNLDREKKAYLNSYITTYFSEEIRSEQIIRKLDPFRAFLPILGQVSGKVINHKKIADEIGTSTATIQSYFQIIEDTLLGFYLPSFHLSIRKSQRLNPKFYLFDTGVKKALEGSLDQIPIPRTSVFGELFESFLINEIHRLNNYFEKDFRLSFYATKNNIEIDLILSKGNSHYLIEIKSKNKIDETEVNQFSELAKDFKAVAGIYYLSNCPTKMKIKDVNCMYWKDFLNSFNINFR